MKILILVVITFFICGCDRFEAPEHVKTAHELKGEVNG